MRRRRCLKFGANTPWYRVRWARGRGTRATRRAMPNRQDCRFAQPEAAPKGCGTRMCRMNSIGSSTMSGRRFSEAICGLRSDPTAVRVDCHAVVDAGTEELLVRPTPRRVWRRASHRSSRVQEHVIRPRGQVIDAGASTDVHVARRAREGMSDSGMPCHGVASRQSRNSSMRTPRTPPVSLVPCPAPCPPGLPRPWRVDLQRLFRGDCRRARRTSLRE